MKGILALALLGVVLAPWPARAEDISVTCEVPAYLLSSDSSLPKVAEAIKGAGPLNILVIGSRSSTIEASVASAYPARLEAMLREKLKIQANVVVELQVKKTAEEAVQGIFKQVEQKKPALVIWQTGTVDAVRSVDAEDFRNAVDEGVVALQNQGIDVILMNPQYSPRTETMISTAAYLDNMRVVAQQRGVPLFDRFAVMRQWNEAGNFDLFSAFHGPELAKRVHDCLGRALSTFVIEAAHVTPAELRN